MNKYIILFCLTLLNIATSYSQDYLFGKVIDEKTNYPILGAEISYFFDGSKQKMITTIDGNFQINIREIDADMPIYIKSSGKVDQFLDMKNAKNNEFFLIKMKEKGLTSVTASRWEQSINEIPASIVIITREEIEEFGYISLQEALENIPGVFALDHRSETDVSIGVRGFCGTFNRNVMIQLNGVNMLSERQNDFPLNKINIAVESIERIEFVRGPMSVIYGAGAFFGVVNIITNTPKNGVNGFLSHSSGTQNTSNSVFKYGINRDGLRLDLNLSHFKRDGFSEDWTDMMGNDLYENYSDGIYSGSEIWQNSKINQNRYSKRHDGFNFSIYYEGFFSNLNYARSNFGFSFIEPGPKDRNAYVSNTFNGQIGYRSSTKGGGFEYEFKTSYLHSLCDIDYNYFDPNAYTPGEDRIISLRSEMNTRTVLIRQKEQNKIAGDLIIGSSFNINYENYSLYNAAEFNLRNWYIGLTPNTSLKTWATYAQTDFKFEKIQLGNLILGDLQFISGCRIEQQLPYYMQNIYNQDFDFLEDVSEVSIDDINDQNDAINFIPRLAFIYSANNEQVTKHFFRGMFGKAIKQSAVIDNAADIMWSYPDSARVYLKPEKIQTFEFGYTVINDTLGFEANLNLFNNNMSDLVVRTAEFNSSGDYVPSSRNSGMLQTNGIEFIIKKMMSFSLNNKKEIDVKLSFNTSYQRTKNLDISGIDPAFSPNLLAGFKFQSSVSDLKNHNLFVNKLGFNISGYYVGEMNADKSIDPVSGLEVNVGNSSGDYYILSANLRISGIRLLRAINYESENAGFYISSKISNLLNTKYFYPTFNQATWAQNGILGRGRQLLFTLGYQF